MSIKHPNQSFIDNFVIPNRGKEDLSTFVYSKKYLETKRKQKFKYFVESADKPKETDHSRVFDIVKLFEYNTLSKSVNKQKYIIEAKQSLGNLPANFVYNGLLYSFNQELNVFVNQHGHTIDISQASAFIDMSNFEPVDSEMDAGESDGAITNRSTPINPETLPATPSGLSFSNLTTNSVDLNWTDNATNESGFKVYYRIIQGQTQYPNAPTNLTKQNSILGVTFGWTDNATNESGFKLFRRPKS